MSDTDNIARFPEKLIKSSSTALHHRFTMLGHCCPTCLALIANMYSAVTEADGLVEEGRELIGAADPSEHDFQWLQWLQIRKSWENARERWVQASSDFANHFETHRSTTSAKSAAKCA